MSETGVSHCLPREESSPRLQGAPVRPSPHRLVPKGEKVLSVAPLADILVFVKKVVS